MDGTRVSTYPQIRYCTTTVETRHSFQTISQLKSTNVSVLLCFKGSVLRVDLTNKSCYPAVALSVHLTSDRALRVTRVICLLIKRANDSEDATLERQPTGSVYRGYRPPSLLCARFTVCVRHSVEQSLVLHCERGSE